MWWNRFYALSTTKPSTLASCGRTSRKPRRKPWPRLSPRGREERNIPVKLSDNGLLNTAYRNFDNIKKYFDNIKKYA